MKERIDVGVYQYPHTEDGLAEAIKDATVSANDSEKKAWQHRYRKTKYVLQDEEYYYGPVGNHKLNSLGYQGLTIAATVEPVEEQ